MLVERCLNSRLIDEIWDKALQLFFSVWLPGDTFDFYVLARTLEGKWGGESVNPTQIEATYKREEVRTPIINNIERNSCLQAFILF